MTQTVEKRTVISNRCGLHTRPAAMVVDCANRFDAEVRLVTENREGDGKSILDLLALACAKDTPVTVRANGPDAAAAVAAIEALITGRFGED